MEKEKNIYEKMSLIANEIKNIEKELEIGSGNFKYKAVSESTVLSKIKPIEQRFGIFSYPQSRTVIESGELESVNNKGEVKKSLFMRIEVKYCFVNIENTSEQITVVSYGDGIDTGDKAPGKAMTYADKYALLKAYKLVTGDDPDQEESPSTIKKITKTPTKQVVKKEELKPELIAKINELQIPMEKIAQYYKKDIFDLTNQDLEQIIIRKEKK